MELTTFSRSGQIALGSGLDWLRVRVGVALIGLGLELVTNRLEHSVCQPFSRKKMWSSNPPSIGYAN